MSDWDTQTQTFHGGQDWRRLKHYITDFSVTTNGLGIPTEALEKARAALDTIDHYPAANTEPARTALAHFFAESLAESSESFRNRLVLGNGASELIDLAIRLHYGLYWRPGPTTPQYMEYERSATNAGKTKCAPNDKTATLMCLVNPSNPTGFFMEPDKLTTYIEQNCRDNSFVLVDESMIFWKGPDWRQFSLVSRGDWIRQMLVKREIKIILIHSWTKIWACPGIRLGSILLPSTALAKKTISIQVPWSVNSAALAFLEAAIKDTEYLKETWRVTPIWRKVLVERLQKSHPSWTFDGEPWLSYVWINTKDTKDVQRYVAKCQENGMPIRDGANGYDHDTYIRIGVRSPEMTKQLLTLLE